MVAVARAMMSAPRLLMLDEPSLGLAPKMVDELLAIVRRIADAGDDRADGRAERAQGAGRRRPRLRARARPLVAAGRRAGAARTFATSSRRAPTSAMAHEPLSVFWPRSTPMSDLSMLINGLTPSRAENGATFERRNPLDGSVATRAPAAIAGRCRGRRRSRRRSLHGPGAQTGPGERRALLLKAAAGARGQGAAVRRGRGGARPAPPAMWAGFNVMLAAGMMPRGRGADHADRRRGDPVRRAGHRWRWACAQPAGVVLGIAPWNAPIILGVRAIATPLACGNTVVLKGSENCARARTQLIVEAFARGGLAARRASTSSPTRRPTRARWSKRWSRTRRCGASTSPARRASASSSRRPARST